MADAFATNEKYQWLTGRAAGVEACQAPRVRMFELFCVGANDRLGQKGQLGEVCRTLHRCRVEPNLCKHFSVVGHVHGHIHQKLTKACELQCGDAVGAPPLHLFHSTAHDHRVVPFEALLKRKQNRGHDGGVKAHALIQLWSSFQATGLPRAR